MTSDNHRSLVLVRHTPVWKYAYWLVCGVLLGLGAASILTIGIFIVPIGAALAVFGLWTTRLCNRSVAAALAGFALVLFYLAWLNRSGPGEVCSSSGSGTSCIDAWNPWAFTTVGLLLIAASLLIVFVLGRTQPKRLQS